MKEQFLELKSDKIIKEIWQKAEQEYEQKSSQKEQAIAANLRGFGLTDEQIKQAISVN